MTPSTGPADTQAGNGNPGVAQIVSDTEGAIGYVDLADADAAGLQHALIENKDGEFVAPTLDGATAALESAEVKPDLTYNPLNAAGADAYPITAPHLHHRVQVPLSADTGETVKGWINYLLTDGQDLANDVDFAALPSSLAEQGHRPARPAHDRLEPETAWRTSPLRNADRARGVP